MKKYISILAIFFSVNAFAQKAEMKKDTLIITGYEQIKFIKIGDRIYQIEAPRLKEVEPKNWELFQLWQGGTIIGSPFTTPATIITGTGDTTKFYNGKLIYK